MSALKQWEFNARLLLFMAIVVPIAVILVALSIAKTFLAEAMAPVPRDISPDSPSFAASNPEPRSHWHTPR